MSVFFREQPSSTSAAERGTKSRSSAGGKGLAGLLAASVTAAAIVLAPESASAQEKSPVTPDAKGVVGGALLGAEVVDLTIGIIGVNRAWPYLVFGAVGAAGGGIGGYFIEQETRNTPEVALYMLAGGMALVIPTVIVSLNATMYKPPEGTTTTTMEPANNQPATTPPVVQPPGPAALPPPATQSRRPMLRPVERRERLSFSLVGLREGALSFSLPAVEVRPLYSNREMWTYGVSQGTEVRVPVFHAAF